MPRPPHHMGTSRACAVTEVASLTVSLPPYNQDGSGARRHWCAMTLDRLVALSLLPPGRPGDLPARLRAGDPSLHDEASGRLHDATEVLARADAAGIGVVAWDDARYPARLRTITDFPPVLWFRGHLDAAAQPAVAVVGSRAASPVALDVAATLAADLARRGVAVVSGMARGVDGAAHRGALSAGRTIGVLGCGVDVVYPRTHEALSAAVVAAGALVSEFPPGTPPLPHHFPVRNRIISGLSDAVVVVEAAERSGSLITARLALDQGRDVMAVPGSVAQGRNRGAHALIRDGAAIVESAADVLRELGWTDPFLPDPHGVARDGTGVSPEVSGDRLLAVMPSGEACSLDWLAVEAGEPASRVLARLLELELAGEVVRDDGGRFMRAAGTCYRN